MLKKEFIKQVIRFGTVDTRNYRYVAKERGDHYEIHRLPIKCLGTTAALDSWEVAAIVY